MTKSANTKFKASKTKFKSVPKTKKPGGKSGMEGYSWMQPPKKK